VLSFDPIAEAARNWDAHWGDDATPSMAAVTSIMRAQQIVMARLNDLLEPLELTFPRYEALMLLFYSRKGQLPLGKISDRLQVHRAGVTNVIDKLASSGYVERGAHGEDRRGVLAMITTPTEVRIQRSPLPRRAWSGSVASHSYEDHRIVFHEPTSFRPNAVGTLRRVNPAAVASCVRRADPNA
jgi:DNA-binding MarR family transcriptional regulator